MTIKSLRNNLIPNLIVIIFFSISIYALVISTVQAIDWVKDPFLGGFLDPSLHFIPVVKVVDQDSWPLQEYGFGSETKLAEIDGVPIHSSLDIADQLSSKKPGEVVVISTVSGGELLEIELGLAEFTIADKLIYIYLPLSSGFISLVIGIWTFNGYQKQPITIAIAVFSTSLAMVFSTYFNFISTHDLSELFYLGIGIAAGSVAQISILSPKRWKSQAPKVGLSFIGYIIVIPLIALGIFQMGDINQGLPFLNTLGYLVISFAVSIVALIWSLLSIRFKSISPYVWQYAETLIAIVTITSLPLFMQLFVRLVNHTQPPMNPILILPLVFIPITYFLGARRFTLPQTQKRVFRSLMLISLTILFGLFYFLIIFVINHVLIVQVRADNPLIIGSMIFLVVMVFEPIRNRIKYIFNLGHDDSIPNHEVLALEFSNKLSAVNSKNNAVILLRDAIEEICHPELLQIFVYSQSAGGYVHSSVYDSSQTNQVIADDAPLPLILKGLGSAWIIQPGVRTVQDIDSNNPELGRDQFYTYFPIQGQLSLLGWIAISIETNKHPQFEKEVDLIESLISQFALVYERSSNIKSLQQRLREMEVLNQIAATINIISDFDQLLVTIFKIVKKVIPTEKLSVVLQSEKSNEYQRFFLIDKNTIHISTRNPQSLPGNFPEKDAVVNKKADTGSDDIENWMYIPMQIDKDVVGVLNLSNKESDRIFSQENLNLAQSIANLITGAIIKSRILQVSQNQTEHLRKLNEVSRQLTSTLSMEPLLKRIVESAMEILHATSGVMLILDESAEFLEFRVTLGPIGTQLLGKRLPKDEGVAGRSYSKKTPIIRNKISKDDLYFWEEAPNLSHDIKNILAVPLMTQSEIFGILEVINKEDELSFTEDDVYALEGFASQAAIAFQNAKQYSNTDQALERRVEELYTMQQIDRDLHASRKLDEALQTTLNAALTYTNLSCGSIMLVDTYYHEIDDIWQKTLNDAQMHQNDQFELSHFPWFSSEINEPYQMIEDGADALSRQLGLTSNYQAHIMITSKLEDDLFSLLILHLDTRNDLEEHDIEFLLTLNNHALIALRNAILYEDLQNAISAKNEFISFISHELKNPLTAIKGHADILAKGMVGEINEEQEDFLKTISHNVRRMSTFITDLSDQSQIESKSLRFVFASAEVADLVNEVLQTYNQQIKGKSIEVETRLEDDLPQVWCDRLRLIQILANLISNAVKYTPEGGKIILSAEYAINEWDPKGTAEVVHISVKDNGFGIDLEDQKQIFTKFFRGSNEKILKISGTGLGLRISKSLTEMMGGTMWFESTPGEGSTFHFTVPI